MDEEKKRKVIYTNPQKVDLGDDFLMAGIPIKNGRSSVVILELGLYDSPNNCYRDSIIRRQI